MDIEELMTKYNIINRDACKRLCEAGSGIDPEKIVADCAAVEQIGKGRTVRTTGTGNMLIAAEGKVVTGMGADYNLDADIEEARPDPKTAMKTFIKKAGIRDVREDR